MSLLKSNYYKVLDNLNRINPLAQLIAVSKSQPIEMIQELYHLGQRDFGENYAHELKLKALALNSFGLNEIRWHFIGHLQSNKIKEILPWITSIHSIDSEELAIKCAKQWKKLNFTSSLGIFLQINLNDEESKSGLTEAGVLSVAKSIGNIPELYLKGLMAIPDPTQNSGLAFRRLAQLEKECHPYTHGELSMGMSSDYQVALKEGATHIRIGSEIFGKRA